jgi:hypothetical protein
MGDNMDNMIEKLEDALTSAFPPIMIDRAMIDEPTARWDLYDDYAELVAFEDKTWRELPAELIVRHATLPIYAGDSLWRATLPGYLRYLLHARGQWNEVPSQLACQLTRREDPEYHPRFDQRIAPFSAAQRTTIYDVLAFLATLPLMEDTMSRALATWNDLPLTT